MPANTSHPSFPQPSDDSVAVWRYMDFAKYVALLKQQAIHFARLDTLDDPFEGSISKKDWDRCKVIAEQMERDPSLPAEWRGRYFDIYVGRWRRFRKEAYASCWHMNSGESEAMWRLYAHSGSAIAVVSSYRRLAEGLSVLDDPYLLGPFLGTVTYKDHQRETFDTGNGFSPVMHKRTSFEHERECRAVVWKLAKGNWPEGVPEEILSTYPTGVSVPIDLSSFVERIIVSPTAPVWFFDTVSDLTRRYGYEFPIESSSLGRAPYI